MKEIELVVDKKYELLKDDYIKVGERTVYRIKALKDFGNVKKGDLGGYIANQRITLVMKVQHGYLITP